MNSQQVSIIQKKKLIFFNITIHIEHLYLKLILNLNYLIHLFLICKIIKQ